MTDPVAAKLVDDKAHPGGMVTGTSDVVPLAKSVAMVREFVPKATRFGTIYNPGEANSQAAITELESVLNDEGLTLVQAPATRTSEVLDAARSLVGKVDVFYITLDNTAISAFASVVQVGQQNDIPVFAVDTSSVENGAIAALGFSYEDVGRETGKQVAAILRGEKPGDIPVTELQTLDIHLNPKAAEAMGVTVPQSILDRDPKIIETAQ